MSAKPADAEAPGGVVLVRGDCIEVMRGMVAESIDAIVTDPPYGLGFMGKAFDKLGAADAQRAFHAAWAVEALRVLKPGGHLIAFGGTRTYHHLAGGVEDAGFEIRDMVSWAYGSGFPKSLDVGKAIDKIDRLGPMRERALTFTAWMRGTGITAAKVNAVTGTNMGTHYTTHPTQPAVPTPALFALLRPYLPAVPPEIDELVASRTVERENTQRREVVGQKTAGIANPDDRDRHTVGGSASVPVDITRPHTEDAQRWHGWGTALKPAVEPAVLARKPMIGTVAANVLTYGTGAVNVDGCRVEGAPRMPGTVRPGGAPSGAGSTLTGSSRDRQMTYAAQPPEGRWPANLIHDGSAEVVGLFPTVKSGTGAVKRTSAKGRNGNVGAALGAESREPGTPMVCYGDEGSAARFYYAAKAGPSERPDVQLCGCLDGALPMRRGAEVGEVCPDCALPLRRAAHPTVKPLALMEYLIRMVLPPGGVVLDPFAGSGSTLVAAQHMGATAIGIEKEAEYVVIAKSRLQP